MKILILFVVFLNYSISSAVASDWIEFYMDDERNYFYYDAENIKCQRNYFDNKPARLALGYSASAWMKRIPVTNRKNMAWWSVSCPPIGSIEKSLNYEDNVYERVKPDSIEERFAKAICPICKSKLSKTSK